MEPLHRLCRADRTFATYTWLQTEQNAIDWEPQNAEVRDEVSAPYWIPVTWLQIYRFLVVRAVLVVLVVLVVLAVLVVLTVLVVLVVLAVLVVLVVL